MNTLRSSFVRTGGPALLSLGLCLARAAWSASPVPIELAPPSAAPGGTLLSWTGPATNAFTVYYRDSVVEGVWLPAPAAQPWPVTGMTWTDALPRTNATRYYRVAGVIPAQRGRVISTITQQTYSAYYVGLMLAAAGYPITPQYGVVVRKIVYETVDPLGGKTTASGVLVLPQGMAAAKPLLVYQHGTIIQTNAAPSSTISSEAMVGVAFASTGYAAVVADFLGLGESPGFHPYLHARTEAAAAIDLMRAARTWCAANATALNGQIFLCGYSQGGHAALALHRELETFHTNEFSITASAPMAGPYDLSGATTTDFLSGRTMPNPYYFPYLLKACQTVYQISGSFSNLLQAPYATTLPPLLDGAHSGGQINAVLPSDPLLILKPEQAAAFRTNTVGNPIRVALRDNDLCDWTPVSPLRLYHCHADQDVVYANSVTAYTRFQARGATQVQLIDPAPAINYGHGDGFAPCMTLAKAWFDSLKH